jgi:hypothetical protein
VYGRTKTEVRDKLKELKQQLEAPRRTTSRKLALLRRSRSGSVLKPGSLRA